MKYSWEAVQIDDEGESPPTRWSDTQQHPFERDKIAGAVGMTTRNTRIPTKIDTSKKSRNDKRKKYSSEKFNNNP